MTFWYIAVFISQQCFSQNSPVFPQKTTAGPDIWEEINEPIDQQLKKSFWNKPEVNNATRFCLHFKWSASFSSPKLAIAYNANRCCQTCQSISFPFLLKNCLTFSRNGVWLSAKSMKMRDFLLSDIGWLGFSSLFLKISEKKTKRVLDKPAVWCMQEVVGGDVTGFCWILGTATVRATPLCVDSCFCFTSLCAPLKEELSLMSHDNWIEIKKSLCSHRFNIF